MNEQVEKWIKRAVGSLLFLGYIPGAPGTVGSAVVIGLLWYFDAFSMALFSPQHLLHFWFIAIALSALSTIFANEPQENFGSPDPKPYILDEVAGQFITFFMVPYSWKVLVLGFVLFRFFDVVKPFFIHKMEELDEGLGITMDDVASGVMANISLHAILFAYHAIRSAL